MSNNEGIEFISGGAVAGIGLSATIGNIGLVGGFGGVSLGIGTMTAAGVITGAAIYGAFKAIEEKDATAIGAIGLGTLGGIGISTSVGGIGLGFAGNAIGIGMGSLAAVGGFVGLGIIYLPIKIFTQTKREKNYYNNLFYLEQITREYQEEKFWQALETEEELETLKKQVFSTSKTVEKINKPIAENKDEQNLIKTEALEWQCKYQLPAHSSSVNALSMSPDGKILATGSNDQTVKLWDLATGKHFYTFFGLGGEVQTVAISPDGEKLITGGFDQRISAWQLKTKKLICSFFSRNSHYSHSGVISSVVFTPDGKLVISASGDRTIRIWRAFSGQWQQTLNGHSDIIWSVAVTPDGQTLVSASEDQTIRLWNLNNYQLSRTITGHTGGIMTVVVSPDSCIVASGSTDKTIKLWKLDTGELIRTLSGHTDKVLSLAISPDSKFLISASCREVKVWCFKTGKLLQNLSGSYPILLSPNGQVLVSGSHQGYLKVWVYQENSNNFDLEPILSGQWWEILGVSPLATFEEVKLAYRQLARRYHPDLNQASDASSYMQAINIAYEQFLHS